MARRNGVLPLPLNLADADEAATGRDLIGSTARRAPLEVVLSNGLGGVNASVVIERMPEGERDASVSGG